MPKAQPLSVLVLLIVASSCERAAEPTSPAAQSNPGGSVAVQPTNQNSPGTNSAPVLLTEAEAIELAEQFVLDNGFTSEPAQHSRIILDGLDQMVASDGPEGLEWVLKNRRNTLVGRAYGLCPLSRYGTLPGWTVIFIAPPESRDKSNRNYGRSVTMGPDGSDIGMEHQPFILSSVCKRLRR